ncbi:MAG: alpha-amylase family glycosyl hydrolase [Colwellia sp.]
MKNFLHKVTSLSLALCLTASFSMVADDAVTKKTNSASTLLPYSSRSIQEEVFYFVLPDRFYNGDKSNDMGASAQDKKRALSHGGFDKKSDGMYHGGDLAGLTQKLPYLDNMGITAIWLTPLLRNQAVQGDSAGYHGYWILDFTEIDPHLGTNADLKYFIAQAHQRNIKVFFDIITNHTADVIKYKECHSEDGLTWLHKRGSCLFKSMEQLTKGDTYTPFIPTGNNALKVPDWLNDAKYYHNQGDSNWSGESSVRGDFSGLDDTNTNDEKVVTGMIDIYKAIIDEFKPDGFRIDTVKHVNLEFWQQFAPALVEHAKTQGIANFFMFGEVYSADPAVLSEYTTTGKMQSVLDFGFQSAVQQAVVEQQGTEVLAKLFAQDDLYQVDENKGNNKRANQLINFTGNHDMGRLAYALSQSKHNYSETEQSQRNLLAQAMMYFVRGVPVVYYGDEQGFVGDGGDKASRQDMMPSFVDSYNDDDLIATDKTTADDNFDSKHLFYQALAGYAKLYQQYPALRYGSQQTLYSQDKAGLFAITRQYQKTILMVVFNTSAKAQSMLSVSEIKQGKLLYQSAKADKAGQIAPLSFAIYQLK